MKKIMVCLLLSACLWGITPVTSFAAINPPAETNADVIKTCYRMFDGKVQYRHWNETRGWWVEPDWIDC